MRHASFSIVTILALLATSSGCATRSISNPVYSGGRDTSYQGEISDFDVVGTRISEKLPTKDDFALRAGSRILLVQSGAAFPDPRMVDGLAAHFEVGTASGTPTAAFGSVGMREAAHLGGYDAVIAYWGVLESTADANAGAVASWVPIVGTYIPDSQQKLRVRTRIVVLDVRGGRWRTLLPAPVESVRTSSQFTRGVSDRDQIEELLVSAIPTAVAAIAGLIQRS